MQAVLTLVIVGELLALALVVAARGASQFDWLQFGMVSFIVLWITLGSAAVLCPLRPWFKQQHSVVAGLISYSIVLSLTVLFSVVGEWIIFGTLFKQVNLIAGNLIIAAIFAGVALRHFYLQQQLRNQQQAELNSRIQALQSRIRPHFLFNSMNSIASLIDIDPRAAEQLVVDLAHLFRASLKTAGLVPLSDELALCEKFIAIEKMRLGERLQVEWDKQGDMQRCSIPSLLLQPLVENAIYHGIQPLTEGGTVKISVHITDTKVDLTVVNPYPATAANSVEQYEQQHNGIALDNIQHRLEAFYGEKAALKLSRSEQQFKVNVYYPSTGLDSNT